MQKKYNNGKTMEIKGKVYCLFEQSGTFKNEFIKIGIPAQDYDIQNNFGETDHIVDLFEEIEKAYDNRGGQNTIFQQITKDDLVIAFFPCIEFSCISQTWYSLSHRDMREWEEKKKFDYMIAKNKNRAKMFELLYKLCGIAMINGIRLIFENPYSINTYLKQNVFLKKPAIIDNDRKLRGDWFRKPTAYWFFNCEPTYGMTYEKNKETKKDIAHCRKSPQKGICSEERSMISPAYARNFIHDFILGKTQKNSQLQLF